MSSPQKRKLDQEALLVHVETRPPADTTLTEVHQWQPSQVFVWFIMGVLGIIFVVVVAIGFVRGWPTVLVISPYVAIGSIGIVVAGVLFSLIDHARHQARMKRLHERSAEIDVLAKQFLHCAHGGVS